ncbi:hypothetical protein AAE478_007753 [Parahypoxylon ruwenzoriense]
MAARSVVFTALVAAAGITAQDTAVDVPADLATRPLVPDVYGYSIEPIWVDAYTSTPLAANLLRVIAGVTGKPPPIRVGGNTADQTYIHDTLSTGNDSVALPGLPSANQFNITANWFQSWGDYFPEGTDLIYTLNLAVNDSAWANAIAQAEAAHAALGKKLVMFELGNEIDHFINKKWRDPSWGVETYIEQFRNLTGQITGSDWYKAAEDPPKFQAGVFADPPWVPDQQDELDDFSIENLTKVERPEDRDIIATYATHLYPQSTCDPPRWLRMRLDLLSNHTTLWLARIPAPPFVEVEAAGSGTNTQQNVSQYAPQVAAADAAGAPLVMGETNSVSCGGRSGISDTFGAALWGVDYVLMGAALGIRKTYFHLGAQSEYSAFTPAPYELKNETLQAGIRPGWYAHYFVARAAAADGAERLRIAALPAANTSELSGYALVFLDMGVWNGTSGLGNPSTLGATDGRSFSEGARPTGTLRVSTPWCAGRDVSATRLAGPGTNAKSDVTVAGVAFDPRTGAALGEEAPETLAVGANGVLEVSLRRAEGVLLEVVGAGECTVETVETVETSAGAAERVRRVWLVVLVVGMGIVFGM